ncbi:hypothetical protein GCM10022198_05800 [Klugiella xanthotipulae]|uniref:DUF7455 domain-containing protein n=1 Tax=Klugiella xanthotipulae TaxID=244735 RepID=A0A543HS75_9MICO|nr:hypothetical protein [Klugiella xanthotipulae]TQM61165.1 hypothetical protein FB466_2101 [Klugiella xanthotipulae]
MTTLTTDIDSAPVDEERPLSALDRCDSCGSQAYIRATMGSGELLFCAHHGNKHKEKLQPLVSSWHDESHKLQP